MQTAYGWRQQGLKVSSAKLAYLVSQTNLPSLETPSILLKQLQGKAQSCLDLSFMGKPFRPMFPDISSLCFILEVFIQWFSSFLKQVLCVKGLQILKDDLGFRHCIPYFTRITLSCYKEQNQSQRLRMIRNRNVLITQCQTHFGELMCLPESPSLLNWNNGNNAMIYYFPE